MTLLLLALIAAPLPIEPVQVPPKTALQLAKNPGGKGAPNVGWKFDGAPADGFDGVRIAISPRSYAGDKKNFIYWAYDGVFMDGKTYYAGLQPNGELGKTALFSVFGPGTRPKGEHCKAGADFGAGSHCHIHYDWEPEGTYEFTIQEIGGDASTTTWEGAVIDLATRKRTVIGAISVGKDRGLLKPWAVTFAEYFRRATCAERPASEVLFFRPVAYRGGREYPGSIRSMNINSGCATFYGDGKEYVYVDVGE